MPAAIKHLDNSGGVTITSKDWPDAVAGVANVAEKFFVENSGDRLLNGLILSIVPDALTDADDQLRIGANTLGTTVGTPFGVAAPVTGPAAGGVWAGTGTRGYRITATNATGESIGSVEVTAVIDDTTKKVNLSWTQPDGATGYRVYRTDTPGVFGATTLRFIIAGGATTSITDDGTATTTGTLPVDNTTAGPSPTYGSPPVLTTTPIAVGDLEIGQQFIYWVNRVVPIGASEAGNPRLAQLRFTES